MENTFLSTLVRIQDDRKQHVISTGVYGFVRHPLYLGCLLMMIGAPLLLGSVYALIITLIGTVLIMVRIGGEEKMLVNELEGYEEYRQKVFYSPTSSMSDLTLTGCPIFADRRMASIKQNVSIPSSRSGECGWPLSNAWAKYSV